MFMLDGLKIKKQMLNEKEQRFISFLQRKGEYNNNFRFLFIYSNLNKESLFSMFEVLLKDILIIECEKYAIVIYHNKERINLENYLDALSEDFGYKIKIFEGFLVTKENSFKFIDFINIYNKYNKNVLMYSSISHFILKYNFNYDELKIMKELVLSKYLKDIQFEKFILALFDNNLNVSKTAKDVYMHRNTVNNRLSNFENDTTLVLQDFKDAMVVYQLLK